MRLPAIRARLLDRHALSPLVATRVARNTGWLVGDRVLRAAANMLIVAWLARYLGSEEFGRRPAERDAAVAAEALERRRLEAHRLEPETLPPDRPEDP